MVFVRVDGIASAATKVDQRLVRYTDETSTALHGLYGVESLGAEGRCGHMGVMSSGANSHAAPAWRMDSSITASLTRNLIV